MPTTTPPPDRPRPSITSLVALIVSLPIVVTAGVLIWLSWSASARLSENLADRAMSDAAGQVASEVRGFLREAVNVSNRYAERIASGKLPDPPGQAWERPMWEDLATSPNVASICFGNVEGDATWLLRRRDRLELGRADHGRPNGTVEYAVDPADGRPFSPPLRTYAYDPRTRPWWSIATSGDGPRWTPVYAWFADDPADATIGTGYVRRVVGHDGQFRGVVVVDVTLGALGDFLRRLEVAKLGRALIVDDQGHLVASSFGRVTDDRGQPALASPLTGRATIDGSPARLRTADLSPYPGIRWHVVAMLPESAFMGDARRVARRTVIAGVCATLVSLVLGVFLSRALVRPILRVAAHVQRVGAGDFDGRLAPGVTREMALLARQINRMTAGLRERMALEQSLALAVEVQQSLLPAADPALARLDVAGRSKYCDQTGGDYFDFVDVARLGGSSLLIAVGDVMGHGIAAALLMASARAALRGAALDRPNLGDLMSRINRVLSADNRHNRFMTLALLELDGETGAARWASAGHDPALVYDPAADTFVELDGGDVPLGISEAVAYEEYAGGPLPPGGILLVGTDGIWEMRDPAGNMYGKDRLRGVVRAHGADDAAGIAAALEADLRSFRQARSPDDDVTFVVVRQRPPSAVPAAFRTVTC